MIGFVFDTRGLVKADSKIRQMEPDAKTLYHSQFEYTYFIIVTRLLKHSLTKRSTQLAIKESSERVGPQEEAQPAVTF